MTELGIGAITNFDPTLRHRASPAQTMSTGSPWDHQYGTIPTIPININLACGEWRPVPIKLDHIS